MHKDTPGPDAGGAGRARGEHDGTRVRVYKRLNAWRVYCPGEDDVYTWPKPPELPLFYRTWDAALAAALEHVCRYHTTQTQDTSTRA